MGYHRICYDQHHVAGFRAGLREDCLHFILRHKFGKRGGCAFRCEADPSKPLCPNSANKFRKLVDFLAGECFYGALGRDAAHRATACGSAGKDREAAILHNIGQIVKLHSEAGIRLIGAVTVHSFPIGQPRQGKWNVYAECLFETRSI